MATLNDLSDYSHISVISMLTDSEYIVLFSLRSSCFWYVSDFWLKPEYFHYILWVSGSYLNLVFSLALFDTSPESGKWFQYQAEGEVQIPHLASINSWPGFSITAGHRCLCCYWHHGEGASLLMSDGEGSPFSRSLLWIYPLGEREGMEVHVPIWSPFTLQRGLVIG